MGRWIEDSKWNAVPAAVRERVKEYDGPREVLRTCDDPIVLGWIAHVVTKGALVNIIQSVLDALSKIDTTSVEGTFRKEGVQFVRTQADFLRVIAASPNEHRAAAIDEAEAVVVRVLRSLAETEGID